MISIHTCMTYIIGQSWDLAAESCVLHAMNMYRGSAMVDPVNNMPPPMSGMSQFQGTGGWSSGGSHTPGPGGPSPMMVSASTTFFSDHLTAFEVWLDFDSSLGYTFAGTAPSSSHNLGLTNQQVFRETPAYLPVLLQMLLSPTHRLRALQLLRRYLSYGSHTVNLALLVGIFPYVLKLVQNQASDIKQILLCIWTSIMGFDKSCRTELIRDKCHGVFFKYLLDRELSSNHRCMAAFTIAEICNGHPEGRQHCARLPSMSSSGANDSSATTLFSLNASNNSSSNLYNIPLSSKTMASNLPPSLTEICSAILLEENNDVTCQNPDLKKWLCLCLAKLYEDNSLVKFQVLMELDSAIKVCEDSI